MRKPTMKELAKMALNAKGWEDEIVYRGFVMPAEAGIDDDPFTTWTMIAPEGTWIGTSTLGEQIEQVLDAESLEKLAEEYERDSAYIDRDHESMRATLERDTMSYGWIEELKTMTGVSPLYNGLYAKIKWTEGGRKLIVDRAYRWMSPTMSLDENGKPVKLMNVALTNRPNFELPPILNSSDETTETTTESFDMDMEKMKEEIISECVEKVKTALAEKADEAVEEKAVEEKSEPAGEKAEEKAVPAEAAEEKAVEEKTEPAEPEADKPEEEEKDVIKKEALNSANDAVADPRSGSLVKAAEQEWRKLKGEDLLNWCRAHPDVV